MSLEEYQIVISHYNECTEWIVDLVEVAMANSVFVYNKGKCELNIPGCHHEFLPNIGREAHTFIHHICRYYHHLPNTLVFLQGNPWDHITNEGQPNNGRRVQCNDLLKTIVESKRSQALMPKFIVHEDIHTFRNMQLLEHCTHLGINGVQPVMQFASGCQYVVKSLSVLCNTLEFYQKLFSMLNSEHCADCQHMIGVGDKTYNATMSAWAFERLAPYIFDCIDLHMHEHHCNTNPLYYEKCLKKCNCFLKNVIENA